jgi:hypothetical protein
MAEPGRAGRFLAARFALFWAIIVSLRLGFPADIVLFDRPKPGRGASPFLGELGLLGSLLRSFCAVESRSSMMTLARCGHTPWNAQYVLLIFSLTAGFGSPRPFLRHFSIRSTPPVCSMWLL